MKWKGRLRRQRKTQTPEVCACVSDKNSYHSSGEYIKSFFDLSPRRHCFLGQFATAIGIVRQLLSAQLNVGLSLRPPELSLKHIMRHGNEFRTTRTKPWTHSG